MLAVDDNPQVHELVNSQIKNIRGFLPKVYGQAKTLRKDILFLESKVNSQQNR